MIYIEKSQLDQIEYVLGQAVQGNHVLFDPAHLRKAFSSSDPLARAPLSEEAAYAVEHHIEKLITLPTLPQKRAYVERLDATTLEHVVLAYFNIVGNTLYESNTTRH